MGQIHNVEKIHLLTFPKLKFALYYFHFACLNIGTIGNDQGYGQFST